MKKKYELIPSDIDGLFRVKALRNFANVKKGDIGGYVKSENNLSHDGHCWVYDNAVVRNNAQVYGNAVVRGNARVYGNALVCDKAHVYDNAVVCGIASVRDNAVVCGNAFVCDDAVVRNNAHVYDNAQVCGNAVVCGIASVRDNAVVCGNARVSDNAEVYGDARVYGEAWVYGNAEIRGNGDYIVFKNWWSSCRFFTWTRSNNMWKVGCFYGTGKELIEKAYEDSDESGLHYKEIVEYVEKCVLNKKVKSLKKFGSVKKLLYLCTTKLINNT